MKIEKKKLLILHIKATKNNIIATITDRKGKTLEWCTARSCGVRGKKRSTSTAGIMLVENIVLKLKPLNTEHLIIYFTGVSKNKTTIIKNLKKKKIKIQQIKDITPIPHNGCKPCKIRRT